MAFAFDIDPFKRSSLRVKVKVKVMHTSTVKISETMTDRPNITIIQNIMSIVGHWLEFRVVDLDLYSKGELGRRNGVSNTASSNILAFLFIFDTV